MRTHSDDRSSSDDCGDPDNPEWDGVPGGLAFENRTMDLDRVDLDPNLAGHRTDNADVQSYGVPHYQLLGRLQPEGRLPQALPAYVKTFYCTSCKRTKPMCLLPELAKKKTSKGGTSNPKGRACEDCLEKRRNKHHAAKKRAGLEVKPQRRSVVVSPMQPQSEQTQASAPPAGGSRVLTAPRALDENLRVLNSKRPLIEDGQETLYCTSCKNEKPVDPEKPECKTCLSCRGKRQRKYVADKLESAAEVEEVRRSSQQVLAADNSGFLVEHFSRHGPDDTEKVQNYIVDRASGELDMLSVETMTSLESGSSLLNGWIRHKGLMRTLATDQGSAFTAEVAHALHQLAAKRPQMLLDLDVRKHFFVGDRTFPQVTALGVV